MGLGFKSVFAVLIVALFFQSAGEARDIRIQYPDKKLWNEYFAVTELLREADPRTKSDFRLTLEARFAQAKLSPAFGNQTLDMPENAKWEVIEPQSARDCPKRKKMHAFKRSLIGHDSRGVSINLAFITAAVNPEEEPCMELYDAFHARKPVILRLRGVRFGKKSRSVTVSFRK